MPLCCRWRKTMKGNLEERNSPVFRPSPLNFRKSTCESWESGMNSLSSRHACVPPAKALGALRFEDQLLLGEAYLGLRTEPESCPVTDPNSCGWRRTAVPPQTFSPLTTPARSSVWALAIRGAVPRDHLGLHTAAWGVSFLAADRRFLLPRKGKMQSKCAS